MIGFLWVPLARLAKAGLGALKVGGAAALKAGAAAKGGLSALAEGGGGQAGSSAIMAKLGEQLGARAAMAPQMPQFGAALQSSLPAGLPSVAGGVTGGSPGAAGLMQSTFGAQTPAMSFMPEGIGGQGSGIFGNILGEKGSLQRDILKTALDSYGKQGQGGAGGGTPGGVAGLSPPPAAVSVPPSTYAPVASGAEGFGGAGPGLAPLVPNATEQAQGDEGDFQRRVMALALAQRMLGGGAAGGGYPGLGGVL